MKFSVNRDEDHSVTIGSVSGLASLHQERANKVRVIWFDAHGAPHDAGVVHRLSLSKAIHTRSRIHVV